MSKTAIAFTSSFISTTICLTLFAMAQVFYPTVMLTYIPHFDSPSFNGADVSYLQASDTKADSVLSACNVERDGKWVKARAVDKDTGEDYTISDFSGDGVCEVNYTGHNNEKHMIKEEGGDYTGTSWH